MKLIILALIALSLLGVALITSGCTKSEEKSEIFAPIGKSTIEKTAKALIDMHGEEHSFRINRCVEVVAGLWNGTEADFQAFCLENFVADDEKLEALFNSISMHFETLHGYFNKMALELKRPLHLDIGDITKFDEMIGGYSPSAHLQSDLFENKIAYLVALNFPFYSLDEKNELGKTWSRKQWAYARVGDLFTANIPADIMKNISETMQTGDNYITDYNIFVGFLVDDNMKTYFSEDMKLISHWNLRDEIKSQYSKEEPLEKQKMIYQVMTHIINQTIPENVINSNEYKWNPYKNILYKDGKEVAFKNEPNTRYYHLLQNFKSRKAVDKFNPLYPTYINVKFDQDMEIPQADVEKMFIEFISHPVAKQIGELIKQRLGRNLEPFDVWYDGFKTRSTLNQDELSKTTRTKYPNAAALEIDLANILVKLGFKNDKAKEIASRIAVEPSRGAGHAWGAGKPGLKSHLRTRIGKEGMDYKGYNIAIHELGHNVEQTLTMYDVDFFLLNGVPNTGFTEAWAFAFQARDLQLLGIKANNAEKEHLDALDFYWSTMEIMGVSIVDMRVWKWLYDNPNATEEQLKNAVISIAKDVWNTYFATVFGIEDQPILAIYSHMIDYPLYLSAYPIGRLIEFQISDYIKDKNLADEMIRMCVQGRLTPQVWMHQAVGKPISVEPSINAAINALNYIK